MIVLYVVRQVLILINIYCDESCHLENDESDIMVLGAITCPDEYKNIVFNEVREIKVKHGLSSWFEIKWTKVSESKVDFYLELIQYFFSKGYLSFRGIVAKGKKTLDHQRYNCGSYDLWYYKMYFRLLDPLIDDTDIYKVLIDIKDSKGGPKVAELHRVLCNNKYDFKHEYIKDIKQINSKESEILQLTDLLIGFLSFCHRKKYLEENANKGKLALINKLAEEYNINPFNKTSRNTQKFNIFIWTPQEARR